MKPWIFKIVRSPPPVLVVPAGVDPSTSLNTVPLASDSWTLEISAPIMNAGMYAGPVLLMAPPTLVVPPEGFVLDVPPEPPTLDVPPDVAVLVVPP